LWAQASRETLHAASTRSAGRPRGCFRIDAFNVKVCTITLDFPRATTLLSVSTWLFDFQDPEFYASHILFGLATENKGADSDPNYGNGTINDYISAPSIGDVLRQHATVEVTSTVNYVEDCQTLNISTNEDVSWIQTTGNKCVFDRRSLKEFSLSSKGTTAVSSLNFYSTSGTATTNSVYQLAFSLVKGQYWKHIQVSLYVNIGQIIVWIILFALGIVGIFQLTKEIVAIVLPPILRFRIKHGGYPLNPDGDNDDHRQQEKPLEMNELKTGEPTTPTAVTKTPTEMESAVKADSN